MTCERVCVLVDVDEGNNKGVYDDVLDMEKIVTDQLYFPSYTALVQDFQLSNKSRPLLSLTSATFYWHSLPIIQKLQLSSPFL
jgi:hypothetical protein